MRRLAIAALALTLVALAGVAPAGAVGPAVFINEIHYDNTGTDTGEAVEVAGPAGTDLSGWSLVLYNGADGAAYGTTTALSGTIPDQQAGFGTVAVTYPSNGIQNGSPDGLALVDAGSSVVQFLSYEGSFSAVGGPANGMTSTDIGVSEDSDTAVGHSLQLAGTGSMGGDFTWSGAQPNTFGAVNTGQTFTGGTSGPTDPMVNEFVANHIGTDTQAFVEVFGDPSTDYAAFTVLELEGDGTGAGVIDAVLPVGTTNAGGYWTSPEDMENGTITVLAVEGFSGSLGADLDSDNDGVLDTTPWIRVVDDVAVSDGGVTDRTYSSTVLAPGFGGSSSTPGGASRIPNGTDTDATSDWVPNDFDGFGLPGFVGSPAPGEAENTPGAVNVLITVPTDPIGGCDDPATLIHDIQGSGLSSSDVGSIREIEGVVVGDFQGSSGLSGFYVQEEDADADGDPLTSEGIFVFDGSFGIDVSPGEVVRVRGGVAEFSGLTEIGSVQAVLVCAATGTASASTVTLPVSSVDDLEAFEGMAVTFPQDLYISEYFNFDRFGEIVLTSERQFQPTAIADPGSPLAVQTAADNALGRITLDDGRSAQNPDPAIHPNGAVFDLTNLFRGGDIVTNVTGVMDYRFGLYRVQPTQGADYTAANPRTASPEAVGGGLKVASFNVLNYFTTIDTGAFVCGPAQDQECRGADDANEFTRQRDKILAALAAIDADVVGVIEIENHPADPVDVPMQDLVDGLNGLLGSGTYDYIHTGPIGTDAIKVGLLYKPVAVTPVGDFALLDSSADPRFDDSRNRPALAQTFMDATSGGVFTVVNNHLKSKGSACGPGDDDPVQGNCNLTRTLAAQALVDWLATDPTGSGDEDFLIIGDLNSYDHEDPIDAIAAGADDTLGTDDDFGDLLLGYQGEHAYSYLFDGQLGYLDYALANGALLDEVTGATAWHINADEPDIIDYDTTFKQPAQDALYAPDPYRSSDHDAVITGLDVCDEVAPTIDVSVAPEVLWPPNHRYVEVTATVTVDDNFDPSPTVTLVSVASNEPDNGADDGNTINDIVIVDDSTFRLRAERSESGEGRIYTITYRVTEACGNGTVGSATVTVPVSRDG